MKASTSFPFPPRSLPATKSAPSRAAASPSSGHRLEDRQFALMQESFARHAGMASADDIARRLRRHAGQPLSQLAHWIVQREVACLVHQGHTWLPLFQFELSTMRLHRPVAAVLRELAEAFDDWDATLWWATPNAWLRDEAPIDEFVRDPAGVLAAARADRFATLG